MRLVPVSIFLTTALLHFAYPIEVKAAFYTGNDLYRECSEEKSASTYFQSMSICMGYILGTVDSADDGNYLSDRSGCLPANVTSGQLVDVVMKFIRDNPQYRNQPGSIVIKMAMIDAWSSCRNTNL